MPIGEFPGKFGWGYDGVCLFAPTALYGQPNDAKRFIDDCHQVGIAVNLTSFTTTLDPTEITFPFFRRAISLTVTKLTGGNRSIWTEPTPDPCVNSSWQTQHIFWISEFHFDGFRFDATQQLFDESPRHLLAEISSVVRETAGRRSVYLVAENEPQEVKMVQPKEDGGYGLDSIWNDDFHHSAMVALTGRKEAYYSDYAGDAQEFLSAAKWGFLYQGQYYSWQKKKRGTLSSGLEPHKFVNFIQNHDQIANSLGGHRIHTLASSGSVRAMTSLLLLGPWTPMLFQGQEIAASSPVSLFRRSSRIDSGKSR